MSPPGPGGGPLLHSGRSIGILELAPLGESPPHLTLLTRSGKNSCPGPPQRQSETMGATSFFFFFLSNAVLFQHRLPQLWLRDLGGGGGTWEKERKKKKQTSQLHKAFPWKSPGSGVLRTHDWPLPTTLWSSGFAGRGTDGGPFRSPCERAVWGQNGGLCLYISMCARACVCVYIIDYIRKFSMYKYKTPVSKHDTTAN